MTPETAIFEGLETLLRLARDARAGGGEQDPVAVAGSVVGVFFWGATPVCRRMMQIGSILARKIDHFTL